VISPSDLADENSFIPADVTTAEGCSLIADAVRQRLGGIDNVVHVVGARQRPRAGLRFSTMASDSAHST
jgi:NAD(P)-dependent dehydrogenase (short-subunit alcohol dehydrogenase family)